MATKPDFSIDITRSMDVASANPATAARAIEMQGEATKAAIGAVGKSLFEGYVGSQLGEYEQKQKAELETLQGEMKSLKEADFANKVATEKALAGVAAQSEEMRAASILTGSDPEEARKMSTVFAQEREAPILAKYRQEQQRLAAMRDQMPEREKEFMLRSESLLRSYITKLPGLANAFRGISQEITGQKNIELYSVSNLYQEIDAIEKQKQELARQAQQADDAAMKRYIKDRSAVVSETEAAKEYTTLSPSERLQLATLAKQIENRGKATEDALKAGAAGVQAFVTNSVLSFEEQSLAASANIAVQLEKAGITRAQLATGAIPQDKLADPRVQQYLVQASESQLRLIDAQEAQALSQLKVTLTGTPTDATAARTARNDIIEYFKNQREELKKNGVMSYVATFSSGSDDPEKTLTSRLQQIKLIQESFGVPPTVATALESSDRKVREKAYVDYPQWSAAYDYYTKMRSAALNNTSRKEWMDLMYEFSNLKKMQNPPIPTTGVQGAASVLQFQTLASEIPKAAVSEYNPNAKDTLGKFVNSALSTGDNSSVFLEKYSSAAAQIKAKIPASEQPQFDSEVKANYNNYVYGELGHGNSAYTRALEYKASNAASLIFTDYTGNAPLKFKAEYTPEVLAEIKKTRPGVFVAAPGEAPVPNSVNAVLAVIDKNIRIRSLMTGESVAALRKEFIGTLQQQGRPSDVFTKIVSTPSEAGPSTTPSPIPVPAAPEQTGVSLGEQTPMTNKERAAGDVKAIEAELKRLDKKPSWLSESAWVEQKRILGIELAKAQEAAK